MVNGSTRTQGSFGEKNTFMFIYIQNTYEIPFNETKSKFTPENMPPHLPTCSVSGSILYLLVPRRVHLQKPAFGLRISSSWRRSRAATARLSACLGVGRIVVFVNFQPKLDSYTVILICIQIYILGCTPQCFFGMPILDITIKNKMCLVDNT